MREFWVVIYNCSEYIDETETEYFFSEADAEEEYDHRISEHEIERHESNEMSFCVRLEKISIPGVAQAEKFARIPRDEIRHFTWWYAER
tara:strand:- start:283 stop:549 length:267 start_codon:yes stop_codon:yes gene_type:complete